MKLLNILLITFFTFSPAAYAQLYTPEVEIRDDLNGNVGIGTVSPSTFLHLKHKRILPLNGNSITEIARFEGVRSGDQGVNNQGIYTSYWSELYGSSQGEVARIEFSFPESVPSTGIYGRLNFKINKNPSGITNELVNVMTLNGENVGIGTSNPSSKLEVNGLVKVNRLIADGLTAGRYGGPLSGNDNPFVIYSPNTDGINDLILFGSSSGATLNLRLYDGDIKLGINSTPSTTIYNNGSANFGSSVSASTFYTTSDQRLKRNVKEVRQKNLEGIKAYEYTYAEDTTNTMHYGLMAQEVEQVFPHMVKTDEEGYKAIAYDEFIPLLIEENRRLERELSGLREYVNQELAGLNERIQKLENTK